MALTRETLTSASWFPFLDTKRSYRLWRAETPGRGQWFDSQITWSPRK